MTATIHTMQAVVTTTREFKTRPATSSDPLFTEAKVSMKQPESKGYPYQVYAPLSAVRGLSHIDVLALRRASVEFEQKNPLFIRTDHPFVCLKMKYGDVQTAQKVMSLLAPFAQRLYKNWL